MENDEDQSIQRKDLEEENHLLKEIIHQAAIAIADVIQVNKLSLSLDLVRTKSPGQMTINSDIEKNFIGGHSRREGHTYFRYVATFLLHIH